MSLRQKEMAPPFQELPGDEATATGLFGQRLRDLLEEILGSDGRSPVGGFWSGGLFYFLRCLWCGFCVF